MGWAMRTTSFWVSGRAPWFPGGTGSRGTRIPTSHRPLRSGSQHRPLDAIVDGGAEGNADRAEIGGPLRAPSGNHRGEDDERLTPTGSGRRRAGWTGRRPSRVSSPLRRLRDAAKPTSGHDRARDTDDAVGDAVDSPRVYRQFLGSFQFGRVAYGFRRPLERRRPTPSCRLVRSCPPRRQGRHQRRRRGIWFRSPSERQRHRRGGQS